MSAPRPAALMTLAIICIVWAGLGLLGGLCGIGMHFMRATFSQGNPALEAFQNETAYQVLVIVGGLIAIGLNALLLAGGIGLLKLKKWSRPALMTYAGLALVQLAIGTVINLMYLMPRTMDAAIAGAAPAGAHGVPSGVESMMRTSMWVGAVFGIVLGLALPTVIFILGNRQSVVAALSGTFAPGRAFSVENVR